MKNNEFIEKSIKEFNKLNKEYNNQFIITFIDMTNHNEHKTNIHIGFTYQKNSNFIKIIVGDTDIEVLNFEDNMEKVFESIFQDLIISKSEMEMKLEELENIFQSS